MARPRTILLVDPDPASAAALGPALRRHGYQVQAARDGSRALQLAVTRSPDLVLLDDGTPLVSAPTVARILRANPRTSEIPILHTGRGAPARPGEPFLRKPFDVDAVLAAVARALAERGEPGRPAADAGLEGSLEQLPLVDLAQMLSTNRRTGRLLLDRAGAAGQAGARAEILFEDGAVVDASADGASGEKALVRLLATRAGTFTFAAGPSAVARRIARRTDELLLDCLRRSDEIAALARRLPPASSTLAPTGAVPTATGAAAEEVRTLLAAPARIADLLDRAAAGDLEVLTAIEALLAAGEVAVAGDRPPPPNAAAPELLSATAAHALRSRLLERRGAAPSERGDREAVVAKLLLTGAGDAAVRGALEALAALRGWAAVEGPSAHLGTAATIDLGVVRVDVVLLPFEPALRPLWGVLAAGAACALVVAPSEPVRDAAAALARAGVKVGVCAPSGAAFEAGALASAAGWCGYVGSEPVAAARALLSRAAGRDPSSPA